MYTFTQIPYILYGRCTCIILTEIVADGPDSSDDADMNDGKAEGGGGEEGAEEEVPTPDAITDPGASPTTTPP